MSADRFESSTHEPEFKLDGDTQVAAAVLGPLANATSLSFVDSWSVTGALISIWGLGALTIYIRNVRILRSVGRWVRMAEAAPSSWRARFHSLGRELQIRKMPKLVQANGVFSPFLWQPWFGQTRVVVPQKLMASLSESSREAVLRHELVHLRRHDARRRLMENVASAIWWWMPICWLVKRRLHQFEELCTDAEVLQSAPSLGRAYATALLEAEEFLAFGACKQHTAVCSFTSCNLLKMRIEKMVKSNSKSLEFRYRPWLAAVICATLLPAGVMTAGYAGAVPENSQPSTESTSTPAQSGADQNTPLQPQNFGDANFLAPTTQEADETTKQESGRSRANRQKRRQQQEDTLKVIQERLAKQEALIADLRAENEALRKRLDAQRKMMGDRSPSRRLSARRVEEGAGDGDYGEYGETREEKIDGRITLDRRTTTDYRRSAYSFRYDSQDINRHRNYVDIVYSANGLMRVNNHGGLKNLICDLGKNAPLDNDLKKVARRSWTEKMIEPKQGHTYGLQIQEMGEKMTVAFRITQLEDNKLQFVFVNLSNKEWSVPNYNRGMAGASGMSRGRPNSRYRGDYDR